MPSRPCLDCGTPSKGARCPTHQREWEARRWRAKSKRYRTNGWESYSKQARANHLATYGPLCPGYAVPRHYVDPADLVVDHDLGVMCRRCNSRKAAIHDRPGGRGVDRDPSP